MPDSFEHMAPLTVRMPNGALSSLAGNLDPHHHVAVADLILVRNRVRQTVESLVADHQPDVVGLSVMTFQRSTARRIIKLIRRARPHATIVVGGYDPSLAPHAYGDADSGVDVIVRGEAEITFRNLLRALDAGSGYEDLPGISYRRAGELVHNAERPVTRLSGDEVRLPNRSARVLRGYTVLGRQADVVETSRGCTYDCSFCSIIAMRGRNFHRFPLPRVIEDIRDAIAHGARCIFFVDDNITLDVARFEELCRLIVAERINHVDYIVQAMTSSIAEHGETLAPLMRAAGFRYVFLGIENVLDSDLEFLRARSKNMQREHGRSVGNATVHAIEHLHRHGMFVVGGLIVGNPDDTREAIETNLEFARRYVDWPYIQHPTPYPQTPMAQEFADRGLLVTDQVDEYDGTTAVVRSRHLTADEIEFTRWRAERWMKLAHLPAAAAHSPVFVLRHGPAMLRHTFRGTSWKSVVGLEDEWRAFERYRAIKRAERQAIETDLSAAS